MRIWQRFTGLAFLAFSVSSAAPGMRHSSAGERRSVPQPFELVAPTAEDSMMAHEQLRYGVGRFEAHVGPIPAKLRVVLFNTTEEIAAYEARTPSADPNTVLYWRTPIADRGAFLLLPGLGGALVKAGATGVPTIAGFSQRDTAFPVRFAVDDEIIALNGRGTPTLQQFGAMFAVLPGGSSVALTVRRAGQVQEHTFAKSPTAVWTNYIIAHEAGHPWVKLYVRARRPGGLGAPVAGSGPESYGSPYLPDWIDETVPMLMEWIDSSGREKRRASLAQNPERFPLRTFLSMEHPTNALRREAAAASPGQSSKNVSIDVQGQRQRQIQTFYDQSAVFGEFLVSRGGDRIIGTLVDAFANGSTFSQLLGKVPGLPPTLQQLDAEWLAWLNRGDSR